MSENEDYLNVLKQDAISDNNNLFLLSWKMRFIDAEFELKEGKELKGTKLEGKVPS